MASKTCSFLPLFLLLNLVFYTTVSACRSGCPGSNRPAPGSSPNNPSPSNGGSGSPSNGGSGSPSNGGSGSPSNGGSGSNGASCPRDALKLGVCANVLNGLLNVTLGQPPVTPCCTLIQGLADLEAAVCLCTVLRANILGININLPISLSLLLNVCSRQVPSNFQCR